MRNAYPENFNWVKARGIPEIRTHIPGVRHDLSWLSDKQGDVIDMPVLELLQVQLIEITKEELPDYIFMAYDGDEQMQKHIHIHKGSIEDQVAFTYEQSVKSSDDFPHRFFKIEMGSGNNKTPIGYTTLIFGEIKVLYTFGININFRADNIKTLWLEAVAREFGYGFYIVTLRLSNQRAIKFFQKHNFKVKLEKDESENYYLLWQQPS